jgi:hypothetical protein
MSGEEEGQFMKQLGGSAAANALTMLIFGVLWGLKKCCDRPSRCKSKFHSCCLDIEVADRKETERRRGPISLDHEGETQL